MTINYDMTFLILVLNSLNEPSTFEGEERCIVHPTSRHNYMTSDITSYAADMNVALAYLNQLDNWRDDKNLFSLIFAYRLKNKYKEIANRYPRQCISMENCIKQLSELEKSGRYDPDTGSRLFGALMAEIFVLHDDRWSDSLKAMALSLGEFIYIMDAVIDLRSDMKKHRYNPLFELKKEGRSDEYFKEILTMLIGNCTIEFEKLPLVEDMSIMRNILYSGIWTKYELEQTKKRKAIKGDKRQ